MNIQLNEPKIKRIVLDINRFVTRGHITKQEISAKVAQKKKERRRKQAIEHRTVATKLSPRFNGSVIPREPRRPTRILAINFNHQP